MKLKIKKWPESTNIGHIWSAIFEYNKENPKLENRKLRSIIILR